MVATNPVPEAIFDAAVGNSSWSHALSLMADELGGATIVLASGKPEDAESYDFATANFDFSVLKDSNYTSHSQFDPSVNLCIAPLLHYPEVSSFDRRAYISDEEFVRNSFYAETIYGQGLFHSRVFKVVHEPGLLSGGVICLREGDGAVEGDRLKRVENWLPMLSIALKVRDRFAIAGQVEAGLNKAMERLQRGVVVVDRDLKILSENAVAARIFEHSTVVSARAGGLMIHDRTSADAIAAYIRLIANVQAFPEQTHSRSFLVPHESAFLPYSLEVFASDCLHGQLVKPTAVATILIDDPSLRSAVPENGQLMRLYGFTQKQAEACSLFLRTRGSIAELAAISGVEESTMTSHLKEARHKVGAQNLTELVKLLTGLSRPHK